VWTDRCSQTQKDLPYQLLVSSRPIRASIVVASFGSSTPYSSHAFDVKVASDASAPVTSLTPPERYTSKPEIKHIFKSDPQSPPRIISGFFTLAILFALPALFGLWVGLGGNLDHASKAFSASPVSHSLFLGSIFAMEGVFFLYYSSWNLFQTLPVALVVSVVAYISGSRALTEVQERRFAGER
jgi:oligosaccharyltransferase complex subunit delta (ribophorin II)